MTSPQVHDPLAALRAAASRAESSGLTDEESELLTLSTELQKGIYEVLSLGHIDKGGPFNTEQTLKILAISLGTAIALNVSNPTGRLMWGLELCKLVHELIMAHNQEEDKTP